MDVILICDATFIPGMRTKEFLGVMFKKSVRLRGCFTFFFLCSLLIFQQVFNKIAADLDHYATVLFL